MKKSVLLIGVGRFGKHIASQLKQLHHDILAIDKNEERIDAVMPFVTAAQIGDATNRDFLESLGVHNFDVCIVAIGKDFQSSLETVQLYPLGLPSPLEVALLLSMCVSLGPDHEFRTPLPGWKL